jgi:hypothetical protein
VVVEADRQMPTSLAFRLDLSFPATRRGDAVLPAQKTVMGGKRADASRRTLAEARPPPSSAGIRSLSVADLYCARRHERGLVALMEINLRVAAVLER